MERLPPPFLCPEFSTTAFLAGAVHGMKYSGDMEGISALLLSPINVPFIHSSTNLLYYSRDSAPCLLHPTCSFTAFPVAVSAGWMGLNY